MGQATKWVTRKTPGAAVTIQINPIVLPDGSRKHRSLAALVIGAVEPDGPAWCEPVPADVADVITSDAGLSAFLTVSDAKPGDDGPVVDEGPGVTEVREVVDGTESSGRARRRVSGV